MKDGITTFYFTRTGRDGIKRLYLAPKSVVKYGKVNQATKKDIKDYLEFVKYHQDQANTVLLDGYQEPELDLSWVEK